MCTAPHDAQKWGYAHRTGLPEKTAHSALHEVVFERFVAGYGGIAVSGPKHSMDDGRRADLEHRNGESRSVALGVERVYVKGRLHRLAHIPLD